MVKKNLGLILVLLLNITTVTGQTGGWFSLHTHLDSVVTVDDTLLVYYVGGIPIDTSIISIGRTSSDSVIFLPNDTSVFLSTTVVYNTSAPIEWEQLDLSSVVGINPAWVALKVTEIFFNTPFVGFRKNGDNSVILSGESGVSEKYITESNYLSCFTDENGIVEWKSTGNDFLLIEVVGFIKN